MKAAAADAPPITMPLGTFPPEVWEARGQIVIDSPIDGIDADIVQAAGGVTRAVYRSVSFTGNQGSEVSGTFFIPPGTPPSTDGWPVVSVAHGTTGIEPECGLLAQPKLSGYGTWVTELLARGYAVALTDYQGLGSGPPHPYLEPHTAAYNVIDAVRALRAIYPSVSRRWLAFGNSQGGQSAWAANEFDSSYGDGLQLVGSVAISPAANLSGMAELSFTGSLSKDQATLMPTLIAGLERSDPELADYDLIHGGLPLAGPDTQDGCGPNVIRMGSVVTAADVRPGNQDAANALREALQKVALPQHPLAAPLLVVNGGKDKLVPPVWVSAAVSRACGMGGDV